MKYEGEFKNGKYHGQGTKTFPDGMKYEGEFKDGQPHGQGTITYPDGRKYVGEYKDEKEFRKQNFFFDNNLTLLPNGNIRDENFEEYELEEERVDFIVYKPEGMRGKRAYIKTDGENYLAWSGPIKIADKSKFLRGDFEKAKEESQPIEEAPAQEQEVEKIEVKQEKESETSDATSDIGSMLEKLTKLYDEGKLTKEEYQQKTDELISQM